MMRSRRLWIPPFPLAAGIAFQATSWVLVLLAARLGTGAVGLAWVHAAGLGWITLTALAVLLHVVPGFTDLRWRGEGIARLAVAVAVVASAVFVAAFATGASGLVAAAGGVLAFAIAAYVAAALATLAQRAEDRTSAAIARALALTFCALLATALLGAALAGAYARGDGGVLVLAPAHALLGIVAWLSVLTSGVSARTFRPMLGARSRWPRVHIVSDGALFAGPVIAAVGVPFSTPLMQAGVVLGALGASAYVCDAADILRRASTPHRAAHAFVGAALIWLAVATVAALGAAFGAPWGAFAVVAALAGWLGQMVNAHLHHLGARVLLTMLRGDEDDTRPWEVLDPRLSWTAFACAQIAVAATLAALSSSLAPLFAIGGVAGMCATLAMVANVARARRSASLPA